MAAAAAAPASAAGLEAIGPVVDKALQLVNTELIGYHKTTYKYNAKGQLLESHTWKGSMKAWELGALILVGVIWEASIVIADAISGTTNAVNTFLDPIGTWVQDGLSLIGAGQPTGAPPSESAGQALNAQLALTIHQVGQIIQPLIGPLATRVAQSAQNQTDQKVKANLDRFLQGII